ncbi:GNAT family N-acetyltransferase [Roseomonas mucosa]
MPTAWHPKDYVAPTRNKVADEMRGSIEGSTEYIYVARNITSELIGFIWIVESEHAAEERHIRGLWVHPDHRRQGLGTKFVYKVVQDLEQCGIVRLTAEVHYLNAVSLVFLLKRGFRAGYVHLELTKS